MSNNIPTPDGQPAQPVPPQYMPPAAQPYPPQAAQPYPGQPVQPYPAQPGTPYSQPYPQNYGANTMAPQRNTLVFVVSILLIIGGAIDIISGFSVMGGANSLSNLCNEVGVSCPSTGMLVLSGIISLLAGIYSLVVGILGVQNAAKPQKADLLFKLGIGLVVVSLISLILSIVITAASGGSAFSGVLGFLLPILFLVGANNMKKQAPTA